MSVVNYAKTGVNQIELAKKGDVEMASLILKKQMQPNLGKKQVKKKQDIYQFLSFLLKTRIGVYKTLCPQHIHAPKDHQISSSIVHVQIFSLNES